MAKTSTTATAKNTKNVKASKPETNGAEKQSTRDPNALRKPQIRLLQAMAKAKGPLNAARLCELAGVDRAWVNEFTGKLDADKRADADEKYNVKSLVTRGYAKVRQVDVEGKKETVWEITATGRKGLETALKAAKE